MHVSLPLFAFACLGLLTTASGRPQLTTVAELSKRAPATNDAAWRLHGRIVAKGPTMLTIDDGTGLAVCDWHNDDLQAGDSLDFALSNFFQIPNTETNLLFGKLFIPEKTGHTAPPAPIPTTLPKLLSGSLNMRSVTVEGVITDVAQDEVDPDWIRLTLESEGVRMAVTYCLLFCDRRPEASEWIDAAVRVTGFFRNRNEVPRKPRGSGGRRNIGGLILVNRLDDILRLDVPREDRFKFPRRERISGTVLATWNGSSLFLRTDDDRRLRVILQPGCALPAVGSEVVLNGFWRMNDFFDWIANASVLSVKASGSPFLPPENTAAFIKNGDSLTINPRASGRIVRVVGQVKDILRTKDGSSRLILNANGTNVEIETGPHPVPPLGSRIAVTGACLIAFEPNQNDNIHVLLTGITVIPRAPADLVILSRPPWWTPGRLLAVICALVAGLIGIFIWNRALQRLVERRGRQLLRAQIERERSAVKTGERTRLAVELHDSLSQNLTGVSFQLDSFRCARDNDATAAERHLETAERILGSCRVELRRCLWDLRSDALDETNFTAAIRKVLFTFADKSDINIRFNVLRSRVSDTIAHAVLRIIRELTANAITHGKARHIRIAGDFHDGTLLFSVADDGCGFDPQACPGPRDGHFGIMGIRERITELHGTVNLTTNSGKGTKVRVSLPVTQTTPSQP